ncbi:hypothetical protein [Brevundimonas sp.]|uniref:hypothetical protein n=1 Tax=Brevundimonas sp. TaxID=1871086 RepID=UPI0035AE1F98
MPLYQFHFVGADGERPALDFSHCADDGEAAREGISQLGQHGSALGVEVWQGDRMVIRIERPRSEVMPVRAPLLGARASTAHSSAAAFGRPARRLQR